jgi:hypothetical protein
MCRAEVVRLREKLAPSAFIKHLAERSRFFWATDNAEVCCHQF